MPDLTYPTLLAGILGALGVVGAVLHRAYVQYQEARRARTIEHARAEQQRLEREAAHARGQAQATAEAASDRRAEGKAEVDAAQTPEEVAALVARRRRERGR